MDAVLLTVGELLEDGLLVEEGDTELLRDGVDVGDGEPVEESVIVID
jgi:hypothetical protein